MPLNIDLRGKVAVVTGAGGILCADMAKTLAKCGAAVAVLDLNQEAADKVTEEIIAAGGKAVGVKANVLQKVDLELAHGIIREKLGKVDILVNGAGGNHPKGTTTKEYYEVGDETREELTSFFDLDPAGIEFTFNLNFLGTLIPSQVFAKDMIGKKGCTIINISSMNAYTPLTKIPAYSGAKAAVSNFTQWLAVHFAKTGIR
ncbi:MAG: SDR family NAD(P)-dependent oxidoreductase, partial [Fusobacteriaceae bacterium]